MNRKMIDSVDRYIDYNALKWFLRHKMPGALKLYEPIYWYCRKVGDGLGQTPYPTRGLRLSAIARVEAW